MGFDCEKPPFEKPQLDEMRMMASKQGSLRRWTFIGLTVGLAFLVTLALGEVTLRLIRPFPDQGTYLIWPPNLTRVFLPRSDLMPGVLGPSRFETNSMGFRGNEISSHDDMRILCIGGSTTECLYLDQEEAWPSLLEDELTRSGVLGSVWVGNAGKSGMTTRHHLVALRNLPLSELGINTIVFLVGVNDLSVFVAEGDQFEPWCADDQKTYDRLVAETFAGSHASADLQSVLRKTALWIETRNVFRWLFSFRRQDQKGEIYQEWRADRQRARPFVDDLPDMGPGLKEFSENIGRMIEICRAEGCRPIFMTQPSMWRRDLSDDQQALLWFGGTSKQPEGGARGSFFYSAGALERAMNAYNDTLLRTCEARGAECLDLAPQFPKDASVFYDDVHFNENGARMVASVLARYLLEDFR